MKKFGPKSEYEKVQTKFSEALKNGVRSDTFVCQTFFFGFSTYCLLKYAKIKFKYEITLQSCWKNYITEKKSSVMIFKTGMCASDVTPHVRCYPILR